MSPSPDIIEDLYRLYEQQMYHQAYMVLRDEYLAEDAVHEAFLKLIKNRGKLTDPGSPAVRRYVFKALESAALDIYRKQKKLRENCLELDESVENTAASEEPGPEVKSDLFTELPGKYASVMRCLFIDGLSIRETSAVLSISEALVRKRCERGRKLLEKILRQK